MNLFSLVATLGLDTSGFSKDVGKAVDEGKKLGSGLTKALNVVTKVGGAIMLAGGTAYVATVKKAVDATADLEQNLGGAKAVWGNYAKGVQDFAETAWGRVGLGTSEYLEMANKMGSLMMGMGFDTQTAFGLSTEAIQRTADVASIMNIPLENAMEAINGLAKGNFTMMDNLGVAMNDTALANYALENGIKKSVSKMSTQEKVALALQMYMDKTAYATGNYAKELEGLGGATSTLKASWKNFLDGSGDPAQLADSVMGYIDVYAKMVSEIAPRIWESFKIVAGNIGERISGWVEEQGGWGNALLVPVNWLLGELGLPDAATIVAQVSAWWAENTMYDKLKEVLTWTLGEMDAAGIEIDWGKLAKNLFKKGNVITGSVEFFKQWILPPAADLGTAVSTWWTETAVPALTETFTFDWNGLNFPSWEDIKSKAEEAWKSIKEGLSQLFNFSIGINIGGFNFGGSTPEDTPGLTSQNNGFVDQGGVWATTMDHGSVNITQNITTTPVNASDLASQLTYNLRYGGGINRLSPVSVTR